MKRLFATLVCLTFLTFNGKATHIVGSELFYECIDSVNHEYKVTLKTKDESRARAFKIPRWPVVDWETQIGVVDLYQKGSLHLLVVTQYQRGAFGHKVPHPFLYLY